MTLGDYYRLYLSSYSKRHQTIYSLPFGARVLDVGCGAITQQKAKGFNKDIYYIGIDICDYRQTEQSKKMIDEYVTCSPDNFANAIMNYENSIDAVISTHNLEHCNEPDKVISAMIKSLKPNGILYLAVPCEASAKFPNREGTLNFYDDSTHVNLFKYNELLKKIKSDNKMQIVYSRKRFFPIIDAFIGLCIEPISRIRNKVMLGTWSLYGFQTVIIAKKL